MNIWIYEPKYSNNKNISKFGAIKKRNDLFLIINKSVEKIYYNNFNVYLGSSKKNFFQILCIVNIIMYFIPIW